MNIKLTIISLIFSALGQGISAQTAEIMWWYDMDDISYGSAATADIDSDGKLEIVFSCYRRDSSIYALNAEDGSLLWKVNLAEFPNQGCNDVAPIISDVDLDGDLEIIVPASCNPRTFCLNGLTGDIEWVTLVHGSDSPPTIADIDKDGKPEILHGGFGGYITALNGEDGSILWDEVIEANGSINGEIIILDADLDGELDIITASWSFVGPSHIKCFNALDLTEKWTFEQVLKPMYHGPSFADLDQDGLMEIVVSTQEGILYNINAEDGLLNWTFQYDQYYHNAIYATSMADLTQDGNYEIVFFDFGTVGVINNDGQKIWSAEIGLDEVFRGAAISDVTSDNQLDLIFCAGNFLSVLDGATGVEHWKINLAEHDGRPNFHLDHGPLVADFNGDSILDIFVGGGYGISDPTIENNFGRVYCISSGGSGGPEWKMFRRDSLRSGTIPLDMLSNVDHYEPTTNEIIVFPNPAGNDLFFKISGSKKIVTSVLITNDGRIITAPIINDHIDTSTCPNGIYLLKVHFEDGSSAIQKVLIQKE